MRMNKTLLKKIISEEIEKISRPRRNKYSLKFLLEETDPGIDVTKGVSSTVDWLNGPGSDPKVRALLAAGTKDGAKKDERTEVSKGVAKSVGSLIPTQREIELSKSVAWPLADIETLEKFISGGPISVGGNSITTSGDLIIDGHHRWSSVFAIAGPKGSITCDDVKIPGASDAGTILSIVQTAIATRLPSGEKLPEAKAGGKNILGVGAEAIKSMINQMFEKAEIGDKGLGKPILTDEFILQCIESKTISSHFKLPSGGGDEKQIEEARDIIMTKVAENCASMSQPADGSPPRTQMPQLDKVPNGAGGVLFALKQGHVNYKEPFGDPPEKTPWDDKKNKNNDNDEENKQNKNKKAQNSGYNRSGVVMVERWQRLAGIIK
jgi:hypothetical protein